jgi:uncharacterized membrane protein
MKKHSRTLILALAAVALGASLVSVYVHYRLLTDPTYSSFCDVSATVNCEAVYESAYGSVAGVPVAAGGAIWAGLVLLLGLAMSPRQTERDANLASYVFLLATIGLAAVLYFAYASFFVLGTLCPLCVTMYIAVIGIFLVSGAAAAPLTGLPSRVGMDVRGLTGSPLALALAAVWVAASASLVAFFPRESAVPTTTAEAAAAPAVPLEILSAEEVEAFEQWMAAQPREALDVDADGARVVVVKFNDYQCPSCRQAYFLYRGIEEKYKASNPEDVRFVSLDFPLEAECGVGNIHPSACEAAAAVRMARATGREAEMAAWLFDNQATLTPDGVKQAARDVAQVSDFDAQYATVLEAVRADVQHGTRLNISGTPTFFINGVRIGASLRPAYFDAAIAYELERTASQEQAQATP